MANQRLGWMLARFRQERGLTQIELAKRTKVTQGYIAQLEAGDKTPSLATLRKLAKALVVPISAMLGETMMPQEWWRPEREKDDLPDPWESVAPDAPDSYLTREEAERAAQQLGYPVIARYQNKIGGTIRRAFRVPSIR